MKWSWGNFVDQRSVVIALAESDGHIDAIFIFLCVALDTIATLRIKELEMLLYQPPICPLMLPNFPFL